jgi:hypothetical protein
LRFGVLDLCRQFSIVEYASGVRVYDSIGVGPSSDMDSRLHLSPVERSPELARSFDPVLTGLRLGPVNLRRVGGAAHHVSFSLSASLSDAVVKRLILVKVLFIFPNKEARYAWI